MDNGLLITRVQISIVLLGPAWRFDDSSFYPLKSDPTKIASIYSLDGKKQRKIEHRIPHYTGGID